MTVGMQMNSPKIKQVVQESRRPNQIFISVQIPQEIIKGIVFLPDPSKNNKRNCVSI
jgi:hypothetical protein